MGTNLNQIINGKILEVKEDGCDTLIMKIHKDGKIYKVEIWADTETDPFDGEATPTINFWIGEESNSDDYVFMSKQAFLAMFGKYLEPEQKAELLGGYYDGDTMHIYPLGIEVGVEANEVVFKKQDYKKALQKIKR